MKILVDEAGGQLISDVIHQGMKSGAFGAGDVKALFTLQMTMKPLPEEDKNEDADENMGDKTTDEDLKCAAGNNA